jgi:hypothetical protein
MDERESPGCRKMIVWTLVVCAAMVICVVTVVIGVDRTCVADLTPRLPIYPNTTVKLQQHNFLTQFGMGESVMILHSDEPVAIVRDWYSRTVGAIVYADVQKGNIRHMGRTNWTVDEAPEGKGSQIILYGYCGA